MDKITCEKCGKKLKTRQALEQHDQAKHQVETEPEKERFSKPRNTIRIVKWSIAIVAVILVFLGIGYAISKIGGLPPTTMQGHIEINPDSHVLREPMPLNIQKHMLEHADGEGPPGVIINYNCDDFECESELIENLEAFANRYPENVYVAPFPRMKAKIVLTRLGQRQILNEYNENRIDTFINRGASPVSHSQFSN